MKAWIVNSLDKKSKECFSIGIKWKRGYTVGKYLSIFNRNL